MFLCVGKKIIVNAKKIGKVFEQIATEEEKNSNDITILFKLDYLRINTTAKPFSVKGKKMTKWKTDDCLKHV